MMNKNKKYNGQFNIRNDIPIPDHVGLGRARKYPFTEMKVGDSFQVGHSERDARNVRASAYHATRTYAKGSKFIIRTRGDNVVYCWRIK